MTEMEKLAQGLAEKHIEFSRHPLHDGEQIVCGDWDAICHSSSYGHEKGLLEIMGSICQNDEDDVEGWLTAEDILKRL